MTSSAAIRLVPCCALFLATVGCGGGTPTEPDPVYELKTETFSGSLSTGGGATYAFPILNPGTVSVAITQLGPLSTLTMGLSLGFWDAGTEICSQQLTTSATLNIAYTATPSGPGNYCVVIFDAGNVQAETQFTVTITHY